MGKPEEYIESGFKKFVIKYAKPVPSKNIYFLFGLPATAFGFTWGYIYIKVAAVMLNVDIQFFMTKFGMGGKVWAYGLSTFIPLMATYFLLYPICRGIQVLLPDDFDETVYVDKDI